MRTSVSAFLACALLSAVCARADVPVEDPGPLFLLHVTEWSWLSFLPDRAIAGQREPMVWSTNRLAVWKDAVSAAVAGAGSPDAIGAAEYNKPFSVELDTCCSDSELRTLFRKVVSPKFAGFEEVRLSGPNGSDGVVTNVFLFDSAKGNGFLLRWKPRDSGRFRLRFGQGAGSEIRFVRAQDLSTRWNGMAKNGKTAEIRKEIYDIRVRTGADHPAKAKWDRWLDFWLSRHPEVWPKVKITNNRDGKIGIFLRRTDNGQELVKRWTSIDKGKTATFSVGQEDVSELEWGFHEEGDGLCEKDWNLPDDTARISWSSDDVDDVSRSVGPDVKRKTKPRFEIGRGVLDLPELREAAESGADMLKVSVLYAKQKAPAVLEPLELGEDPGGNLRLPFRYEFEPHRIVKSVIVESRDRSVLPVERTVVDIGGGEGEAKCCGETLELPPKPAVLPPWPAFTLSNPTNLVVTNSVVFSFSDKTTGKAKPSAAEETVLETNGVAEVKVPASVSEWRCFELFATIETTAAYATPTQRIVRLQRGGAAIPSVLETMPVLQEPEWVEKEARLEEIANNYAELKVLPPSFTTRGTYEKRIRDSPTGPVEKLRNHLWGKRVHSGCLKCSQEDDFRTFRLNYRPKDGNPETLGKDRQRIFILAAMYFEYLIDDGYSEAEAETEVLTHWNDPSGAAMEIVKRDK